MGWHGDEIGSELARAGAGDGVGRGSSRARRRDEQRVRREAVTVWRFISIYSQIRFSEMRRSIEYFFQGQQRQQHQPELPERMLLGYSPLPHIRPFTSHNLDHP